ncbi:M23 family peptidase [Mucilaginibacter conchicola]|uniref:M23 family peptidase n=1 Tax=Mucilaginibacter conchicola TaxID=2303333 RepID=A0A372NRS0_9SPHI|nr:M23 family metallopeptidase [Mucilaginibacter conchicola]RFZ91956.1 M23 family peptidase [Mucilaginibacter conchicola]
MKKTFLTFIISLFFVNAFSQDLRSTCEKINGLNNRILNGSIKRTEAVKEFAGLMAQLRVEAKIPAAVNWMFPLQGYKTNAIGGTNGNGYSDKGYNYLDGNKHSAHPAHDIFINDKNQDDIDDRSQQPVNVLAVDNGIVVACSNQWEPGSKMRGGKFIWVYHPAANIFTYYAHNRAITVKPGDEVKQGQKIAEVGRTGLNAYKKRSPTHLHFSAFKIANGLPVPFNPYQQLKQSVKK